MIKYNNKTINKLEHNASEVNKMYYDGDIAYGVDGGSQPTPPTPSFDGKWLATYTGGTTSSAQCDSSSAITQNEIAKTDLVSVEIGDCVTTIGQSTFSNCSGLTSVTIPDSVTIISDYAFNWCRSLISVIILNSVTKIGGLAFFNCSSLASVTIGSRVTSIGSQVFRYCTGLTSITIETTTPPTLGNYAFDDTNNCPIYVPAASVNAYKRASRWSTYSSRIQAIP